MRLPSMLKTEVAKIEALLSREEIDGQPTTVEALAPLVLEAAWTMYQSKMKYVVVGRAARDGSYVKLDPNDPFAAGAAFLATSEATAKTAANMLRHSARTKETWAVGIFPIRYQTPADMHGKRKADLETRDFGVAGEDQCRRLVAFGADWAEFCIREYGHGVGSCLPGPRESVQVPEGSEEIRIWAAKNGSSGESCWETVNGATCMRPMGHDLHRTSA